MQSSEQRSPQAGFPGSDSDPLALVAAAMFPASIVAHGAAAQPVERLMALQAGFSRLVGILAGIRLPVLTPPLRQPRPGTFRSR